MGEDGFAIGKFDPKHGSGQHFFDGAGTTDRRFSGHFERIMPENSFRNQLESALAWEAFLATYHNLNGLGRFWPFGQMLDAVFFTISGDSKIEPGIAGFGSIADLATMQGGFLRHF